MEIWIDAEKYGNHSDISGHKVWEGQDPEVASVALDDFRGQEEAISLIGMVMGDALSLIHI